MLQIVHNKFCYLGAIISFVTLEPYITQIGTLLTDLGATGAEVNTCLTDFRILFYLFLQPQCKLLSICPYFNFRYRFRRVYQRLI